MATIELSEEELKTFKDMINLARALMSSVTGAQIAGLAARIGEIMPVLDALSSPRVMNALSQAGDDIADLIDVVVSYHRSGTIRKALELVTFLSVLREALSTPAVARMAESANEFLLAGNQLLTELERVGGVKGLAAAAREASLEAERDQRTVGAAGLLRALKEPDVQKAIKFFLHFLKVVGT